MFQENQAFYWNELSEEYQRINRIATDDFHYGPLLAGEKHFKLIPQLKGKSALELGCGAAQNSLYLASQGVKCTAIDISQKQLDYAQKLSHKCNLSIKLIQSSIDEFNFKEEGKFDFIHSTWAFPFSYDQERLIHRCAKSLNSGGTLLITTGHPIFAGEWIILDKYEQGIFLPNYFNPPIDTRFTKNKNHFIHTKNIPIGTFTSWLLNAGLELKALIEPKPQPIHNMSEEEIKKDIPYDAQSWRELYKQITKIPFVIIYKAQKK